MTVFVNNTEIKVFDGAKVADAVRAYYAETGRKYPCRIPLVKDKYGNKIAPDGRLSENNHIFINVKSQKNETI